MPPPDDARSVVDVGTRRPPAETVELRRGLQQFVSQPLSAFVDATPTTLRGASITVGAVKWGVYAFFDYDGEPIYVGQTRESLGQRIARHLTNQRTDAVAMAVLDPFEVRSIAVWPLPEYQDVGGKGDAAAAAAKHLDALERTIFVTLVAESEFGAILNEKDPPDVALCDPPTKIWGEIVSEDVRLVRQHPVCGSRAGLRRSPGWRISSPVVMFRLGCEGRWRRRRIDWPGSRKNASPPWGAKRLWRSMSPTRRWMPMRIPTAGRKSVPLTRSQTMARVKSRDTSPERAVRGILTDLGYRYRLQRADLPGKPDIAFVGRRKAIFVHGCFWHGHACPRGARTPKTNTEYWRAKIARNRARDGEVAGALADLGWRVMTIWECDLRSPGVLAERLRSWLDG